MIDGAANLAMRRKEGPLMPRRRVGWGGMPVVEESWLANAAARMMQVFQEAFLTLQKLKTGGKQTMVVQHVQVSEGGRALIAGSVGSETLDRKTQHSTGGERR